MFQKSAQFLREVWIELKKCEWPVKRDRTMRFYDRIRELVDSTIVVVVAMVILACFIGSVDYVMARIVRLMLR